MRSALFSTHGLLWDPSGCSGSPGWAVRGQCSPRLSALPGPAPGVLAQPGCSPWAPKLGLGRLPGAASPTFSRQEGGRRRAFPVVHWQQQRRHRSQLLRVAAPGLKFSREQGGGAQAGARAEAPAASSGVGSTLQVQATWRPALYSGSLLPRPFPPERGKHLQGPQEPLSWLSPDSVSLTGLSTGNLFWSIKSGNHLSCLLSPIPPTPLQYHFLPPIWIP